ncbi:hypothetical protein CXB51_027149 [Gossypium anomalum]|uniref:Uncharacterized protein n=1 Tax=Gossypium anomalum TaxID=47600 RepID=A0A8J5YBY6_9ROSI|nr:hypothetical protein CXB51_027149 [Gossypium anomalum]
MCSPSMLCVLPFFLSCLQDLFLCSFLMHLIIKIKSFEIFFFVFFFLCFKFWLFNPDSSILSCRFSIFGNLPSKPTTTHFFPICALFFFCFLFCIFPNK